MKKINVFVLFSAIFQIHQIGWASTLIQGSSTDLNIYSVAPPALVYVEDSLDNITGADPNAPFNAYGQQPGNIFGINQIPSSKVDQDNEAVGDMDSGNLTASAHTTWSIDIYDGTPQTYTINIKGIATGDETITLGADSRNNPAFSKNSRISFDVLINPGQLRKVKLTFDSTQGIISFKRVVSGGDLLIDVKTACQLGQITSSHICKRLVDQSEAIQDSLADKHYKKTEELIWVFLHSLGESRPEGCKDDDDHNAVQKPALTILKEDAKALFAQVEQDEKTGYGNHDHNGEDKR